MTLMQQNARSGVPGKTVEVNWTWCKTVRRFVSSMALTDCVALCALESQSKQSHRCVPHTIMLLTCEQLFEYYTSSYQNIKN